jgi:hypothetical protein
MTAYRTPDIEHQQLEWSYLGLFALAAGLAWRSRRRIPALVAAWLLSAVTALSWQVLAINHMCVHAHLNAIVFQLPLVPLTWLVIGQSITRTMPRFAARLAGVLAIGLTVTLAYGAYRGVQGIEREAFLQRQAMAKVAERLATGLACDDSEITGHIDEIRLAIRPTDRAWGHAVEYSRLADGQGGERCWLMRGHAFNQGGRREHGGRRELVQLVLVRGEEVVPLAYERMATPELRAKYGLRSTRLGWLAHVPVAGPRPRLFLVGGKNAGVIREVPWPDPAGEKGTDHPP